MACPSWRIPAALGHRGSGAVATHGPRHRCHGPNHRALTRARAAAPRSRTEQRHDNPAESWIRIDIDCRSGLSDLLRVLRGARETALSRDKYACPRRAPPRTGAASGSVRPASRRAGPGRSTSPSSNAARYDLSGPWSAPCPGATRTRPCRQEPAPGTWERKGVQSAGQALHLHLPAGSGISFLGRPTRGLRPITGRTVKINYSPREERVLPTPLCVRVVASPRSPAGALVGTCRVIARDCGTRVAEAAVHHRRPPGEGRRRSPPGR